MDKNRRTQIEALVNIHIDGMIEKLSNLASILGVNIDSIVVSVLKSHLSVLAMEYDAKVEPFDFDSIDTTEAMRIIDRLSFVSLALLAYDEPVNIIDIIVEDPEDFKQNLERLPSYYEMEEEERREEKFKDLMSSFNFGD